MPQSIARWTVWRQPKLIPLLFIVESTAIVAPLCLTMPVKPSDVGTAALLTSLSIAYSLLTRRWERARRALREGTQPTVCPNLLAAWGIAAAIMLPLALAVAVVIVAAVAEWPAFNITGQARPYRYIYSASGTVLAAVATRLSLDLALPPQVGFLVAAGVYTATCVLIIALAVVVTGQSPALRTYLRPNSYRLDVITALIALGQVELHLVRLPLLWLSLPATIAVQRWATRADLRSASVDTGAKPMSEQAWLIAATEIVEALPVVAVMRVTSSDPVTAHSIAQMQAGCDAVGRIGEDGMAVLLVDCPDLCADALAARLRTALRHGGVTASVATAAKPRDGQSLGDLLAVCEAELIARDAVVERPPQRQP